MITWQILLDKFQLPDSLCFVGCLVLAEKLKMSGHGGVFWKFSREVHSGFKLLDKLTCIIK